MSKNFQTAKVLGGAWIVVATFAGVISGAQAQAPQVGVAPVAAQAAAADAKLAHDGGSKLTGYERADGTWLSEALQERQRVWRTRVR